MLPLSNLKELKVDMEKKGWVVSPFMFTYKKQSYIVLAKLYMDDKPKYALLELQFCRENNIGYELMVPANASGLMIDAKTLREYFGIEYCENLGDILKQFAHILGKFIPVKCLTNITEVQKKVMLNNLCKSGSEDPDRTYCYKIKRNPQKADGTYGKRSIYNSNKAQLLLPQLFEKLKNDPY